MMSVWVLSQLNGGGQGVSQQCPPLAATSPLDPDALTYTVQHQVLGSDQWTALATGLREPGWAALGLRKGVQHIFRVLSTTIKSSSKPSPPSEPVQLLEHGEPGFFYGGGGGWGCWARELGLRGGGSRADLDILAMGGIARLGATLTSPSTFSS